MTPLVRCAQLPQNRTSTSIAEHHKQASFSAHGWWRHIRVNKQLYSEGVGARV